MCPPAALALAATAVSAIGTGLGALQANAQAKYRAKIADRNAALEREAAQVDQQNMRDAALEHYRKVGQLKGRQIVGAAANGVGVDFGTAADTLADTDMLANEDVSRLYKTGNNNLRGRDIQASNFNAEANAARSAGKAALIKGLFDVGSTVLGGAQQYKKLKAA
jgi:hypothetical protein